MINFMLMIVYIGCRTNLRVKKAQHPSIFFKMPKNEMNVLLPKPLATKEMSALLPTAVESTLGMGALLSTMGSTNQLSALLPKPLESVNEISAMLVDPVLSRKAMYALLSKSMKSTTEIIALLSKQLESKNSMDTLPSKPLGSTILTNTLLPKLLESTNKMSAPLPKPLESTNKMSASLPKPLESTNNMSALLPKPLESKNDMSALLPTPVESTNEKSALLPKPLSSANAMSALPSKPAESTIATSTLPPKPVESTDAVNGLLLLASANSSKAGTPEVSGDFDSFDFVCVEYMRVRKGFCFDLLIMDGEGGKGVCVCVKCQFFNYLPHFIQELSSREAEPQKIARTASATEYKTPAPLPMTMSSNPVRPPVKDPIYPLSSDPSHPHVSGLSHPLAYAAVSEEFNQSRISSALASQLSQMTKRQHADLLRAPKLEEWSQSKVPLWSTPPRLSVIAPRASSIPHPAQADTLEPRTLTDAVKSAAGTSSYDRDLLGGASIESLSTPVPIIRRPRLSSVLAKSPSTVARARDELKVRNRRRQLLLAAIESSRPYAVNPMQSLHLGSLSNTAASFGPTPESLHPVLRACMNESSIGSFLRV